MKKKIYSYATTEDLDLKLAIFIMHTENWEKGCCYHSAVDTFLSQEQHCKALSQNPFKAPAVASCSGLIFCQYSTDKSHGSWLAPRQALCSSTTSAGNRGIVPVRAGTSNHANTALGKASSQRERHGRCPSGAGMACQNNAQVLAHTKQFDLSPVW